jgi:hypothetical protein
VPSIPISHSTVNNETFFLSPADRNHHTAIFGITGMGKSTLIRNLIAADLAAGNGFTVLDPHGSLIEDVLDLIPTDRTNDVIYLRPGVDTKQVVGVNLLHADEQQRHLVVSNLINISKNIWPEFWGPQSEFIHSNLAQLVLSPKAQKAKTIVALHDVLTDPVRRKEFAARCADPAAAWFADYFDHHWSTKERDQAAAPVLNKVNFFVRNKPLCLVGQHRTSSRSGSSSTRERYCCVI